MWGFVSPRMCWNPNFPDVLSLQQGERKRCERLKSLAGVLMNVTTATKGLLREGRSEELVIRCSNYHQFNSKHEVWLVLKF